jgi:hypothetical protein
MEGAGGGRIYVRSRVFLNEFCVHMTAECCGIYQNPAHAVSVTWMECIYVWGDERAILAVHPEPSGPVSQSQQFVEGTADTAQPKGKL